jgi:hypothetical protein
MTVGQATRPPLTGNITTTGDQARGLILGSSDNNTTTINGIIITSDTGGNAEPIVLLNSDSIPSRLSGAVHSLGGGPSDCSGIRLHKTIPSTFKRGASFIGGIRKQWAGVPTN